MGENKKCTNIGEIDFIEILLNELKEQNIVVKGLTLERVRNITKELDVFI